MLLKDYSKLLLFLVVGEPFAHTILGRWAGNIRMADCSIDRLDI
ncbi:MAG: hypothetical protein H6Q42_2615, partial [Deltaproteobacteria bacterium]|nr:hypothetical protein [Deltaproteobacteria bacterium]